MMNYYLTPRPNPKLLSIVIPCYNEEAVIHHLKERLNSFQKSIGISTEVILVNDGSSDQTINLLVDWARQDSSIQVVSLARNFGHQIAVTAGMDHSKGDVCVIMDADLQDPPEVIVEMLSKYREGYEIVYGQRLERAGESWFKKWTAWAFYRIMNFLVHKDLPLDSGDFRLISRTCLDVMGTMRENHRFLRGMNAWIGFPQTPVHYNRDPRVAGETKYPLRKMLKLALNAAIAFSPIPLRFSLALGFIIAIFGFFYGIYALYMAYLYFVLELPVVYNRGWSTIVVLICVIGGSILISIGILGEYVARIFEEVKGRPLYSVHFVLDNKSATKKSKKKS